MTSALITSHDAFEILKENLDSVKIFDATYPPRANGAFIPNSIIFDIDDIADPENPMPHMVPPVEIFAAKMQNLGIKNSDTIIIYDAHGIHMAAARAWWMMRLFGHDNVRVINGGLPAWAASGLPLAPAPTNPQEISEVYQPNFQDHLLVDRDQMQTIVETQSAMILDARPRERFLGLSAEPRANMRAGHMPHAVNVPTGSLLDPATGGMKQVPPLPACDSNLPIVTTCGSGVTACVIALALFEAGKRDVAVYDGSWAEWGNAAFDLPINVAVETGN